MAQNIVVLDNGGANIKIGLANTAQPVSTVPNATAKFKGERGMFVADQILGCSDPSVVALRRPIDRGYVVNWELERVIWDRVFKSTLPFSVRDCGLVLTEPLSNLPTLQEQMDQVVFEGLGMGSYLPLSPPELALRSWAAQRPEVAANEALCGLVVDCGFSFTHVVPIFDGVVLQKGVRRIDLGGKALTNYLKELVSFRSINMMEETYLVEHIKEASCFVSQDLAADITAAKAGVHRREFVLPDGVSNGSGFLRLPLTKDQMREAAREGNEIPALQLNNERFMVPELVFRPSNIGMKQAGLAETCMEAAKAVHPDLRPLLFSNVLCVGGTSSCPGFATRLAQELRPLVPCQYQVAVRTSANPIWSAWQGGSMVGGSPAYPQWAYSRAEYEERGSLNMRHSRRF